MGDPGKGGDFVQFPFESANFPLLEGDPEQSNLRIKLPLPESNHRNNNCEFDIQDLCCQHHPILTHRKNCGTNILHLRYITLDHHVYVSKQNSPLSSSSDHAAQDEHRKLHVQGSICPSFMTATWLLGSQRTPTFPEG